MQIKTGQLTCYREDGNACTATVTLTKDNIVIQTPVTSQDAVDKGSSEVVTSNDIILDEKQREVTIYRQAGGGLGISVKGGAEHGIPVLISKVFAGKPADKTKRLFPGDAILTVNGSPTTGLKHDDVVDLLKACSGDVTLKVRAFARANRALRSNSDGESNKGVLKSGGEALEKKLQDSSPQGNGSLGQSHTSTETSISLQFARLKKKSVEDDSGVMTPAFQVVGTTGERSAFLRCDTANDTMAWVRDICAAIQEKNSEFVYEYNSSVANAGDIHTVGWVEGKTNDSLREIFLVLRGDSVYFFEDCRFLPETTPDTWNPLSQNLVFECLFRYVAREDGTYCIMMQNSSGPPQSYSVETQDALQHWSMQIRDFRHNSVYKMKNKVYSCQWNDKACDLTIDFNRGFSLREIKDSVDCWSYKFSQLKGSSDDGQKCITFTFLNGKENRLEEQLCWRVWRDDNMDKVWDKVPARVEKVILCERAYPLLFCVHSFLAAKLAIVDPQFFKDETVVKQEAKRKPQSLPSYNGILHPPS